MRHTNSRGSILSELILVLPLFLLCMSVVLWTEKVFHVKQHVVNLSELATDLQAETNLSPNEINTLIRTLNQRISTINLPYMEMGKDKRLSASRFYRFVYTNLKVSLKSPIWLSPVLTEIIIPGTSIRQRNYADE